MQENLHGRKCRAERENLRNWSRILTRDRFQPVMRKDSEHFKVRSNEVNDFRSSSQPKGTMASLFLSRAIPERQHTLHAVSKKISVCSWLPLGQCIDGRSTRHYVDAEGADGAGAARGIRDDLGHAGADTTQVFVAVRRRALTLGAACGRPGCRGRRRLRTCTFRRASGS